MMTASNTEASAGGVRKLAIATALDNNTLTAHQPYQLFEAIPGTTALNKVTHGTQ